ncbi:MAG TPA: PQQ-dependent sugar dehydrogenase [Polyangiaceae bacterium]|nr:PQQ-dependent sugar dehydrogenase [Polyangiaceae bacterium]
MHRSSVLLSCALVLLSPACNKKPSANHEQNAAKVIPAEGQGQRTEPRVGPTAGAPVETAPPNVPENKPAFPGQTRAPAIHTNTALKVSEIAGDFDEPWAIAFLPDGRMLVTEKHDGELFVVTKDGKKSEAASGVPRVDGTDQGGLLDVEVGPDYATSKLVYLSYYEPRDGGNGLAVARARFVDGAKPKLEELKVIFRMQPTLDSSKHAGGRLVFAPDGMLFVTLGERSILEGRKQARDLKSDFGKVVRIAPDGSVPKDNPFVGKPGARPEIWSLGHRNVLGADLDARHRLWVAEMGPRGGDELNLVEKGKDYGWPTIGYGEEYSGERIHESTQAPGLEQPVYYWDPVISPGALIIYSGDLIPEWKGNVLIAGLSSKALIRLTLKDDRVSGEERLLMDRKERMREVVQGPEGAVYVLTDGSDGKLLKITPAGPPG